jgi:hypothetical protein
MRQRGTVEKERFEGLSPRRDRLEGVYSGDVKAKMVSRANQRLAIQVDGQPEVAKLSHGLDRVLFK